MSQIAVTDKIYVAGHRGLVGSAIVRSLQKKGYNNIVGRTHKELDLTNQAAVQDFFETIRFPYLQIPDNPCRNIPVLSYGQLLFQIRKASYKKIVQFPTLTSHQPFPNSSTSHSLLVPGSGLFIPFLVI